MYINVSNPLSNKDLKKIVRAYSESCDYNFYKFITKNDTEEYEREDIYNYNSNNFYTYMFNMWKNNITSIDMNRFNSLKQRKIVEDQFLVLQAYLKNTPDITSKDEIYDIVHGGGEELYFLFLRYGHQPELRKGWNEFYSEQFTSYQRKHFPNDFSFVINTMSFDTTLFCNIFTRRCNRNNLPFYYKYNDSKNFNTKIVIYSDEEHLMDYLGILRGIKEDYPKLVERCNEPNRLYGKIDNWIGFGSHKDPYHDTYVIDRTKHIDKAIGEFTMDYLCKNTDKEISLGKTKVGIIDYVTEYICTLYINKLYYLEEQLRQYKLSRRVLKSRFFYKSLFRTVKSNLIGQLIDGKIDDIEFLYSKGAITISKKDIEETIRKGTYTILESDPGSFDNLEKYIISTGSMYDISDTYFLYNKGDDKNKTEIKK